MRANIALIVLDFKAKIWDKNRESPRARGFSSVPQLTLKSHASESTIAKDLHNG
jgi:hypothetical protein